MNTHTPPDAQAAVQIFRWIVSHPKRVVTLGVLIIVMMASTLPQLTRDTRSDAFLADDNPALVYREKVKTLFGLSDPMVIAVIAESSVFTPEALNTVQAISDAVVNVENIDPDGITSLATENNIVGTSDGMDISPFFEGELSSQSEANKVRDAIRNFPLYQGSLVAADESATLVIAELLDETVSEQTYAALRLALDELPLPEGITLHVAGEGAISGFLGSYIDADAQRLNPLAALVITIIVFFAFLRFGSTFMANMIIAASAIITTGAMSVFGVPFYVITNALPVILIGIAVADSIHIYSEYFERRALHPEESINESIVTSMVAMWRPVTLTTLTTIAGFLGLYFAAYMPPFKYFGLFTAFGVGVAWLYSMTFLPAAMSLLKTNEHPHLAKKIRSQEHDIFAKLMIFLGEFTRKRAKFIIAASLLIAIVGISTASRVAVNEVRIETFHHDEPLYQADKAINSRFNGTNYLDIVVDAQSDEGLFDTQVLAKIEAMQAFAENLPVVHGSTSIVDYLKQMNRALNDGHADQYILPSERDLVAQYFLLYSASSDPTDFEEEVDYDYRIANVRLNMSSGSFVDAKLAVETMQRYIDEEFNDESVHATLSGRVNLNYHWIKDLGHSHFTGMAIAMFLVWLVSSLLFRSLVAGTYALIPIATSILLVYSSMVGLSINLGIGTSMFAAVAIGLGVDFAIHTIDRLRSLFREIGDLDATLKQFYPSTGRALFFNLLAIALGFGVLISSKVVPLNNFGSIVAISVFTSFLASMTLLPALIKVFKPRFIVGSKLSEAALENSEFGKASTLVLALGVGLASLGGENVNATDLPSGRSVIEKLNARDDGEHVTSHVKMKMIDRRGKERVRETKTYRKYFGEEKRTVLFYLSPKNVKGTGFLTYDYPNLEVDDDQWLYLPALRKARRISASDRGDYFLGTDFSYEDIKKDGKMELGDYQFESLEETLVDNIPVILVQAIPATGDIAKELGYGKIHIWVDPSRWVTLKAEYWDIKMNPLKTLEVSDIRKIDGILTRHKLTIKNHKTGHFTEFQFSQVDYEAPVDDKLFTRQALKRGAR